METKNNKIPAVKVLSFTYTFFLNSEAYFDIQLYKPVNKQTSKQTKIKTEYRF